MKKRHLLLSLLFVLLFVGMSKATIHDINVGNFYFDPISVDVQVGDTLRWTLVEGTHTVTSTSVPSGASTFDYTFSGVGDTFIYEVAVEGLYEYLCSFHPATMKGSFSTPAMLPYVENFEYPVGDYLTYHGWVNHSGSGSFFTLADGSLTYPGYIASGIGNHILFDGGSGSREDAHRGFTGVSSDNLYASFLINVSSADLSDGYVAHFMPAIGNFNYRGRLFLMDDGSGNIMFGISKGSTSTITWATGVYNANQTYLLVIKYEYVGDATGDDDVCKLYINPVIGDPEPGTADAVSTDVVSDEALENFALRQGGEDHNFQFDGLIVATTWEETVPVELAAFSANVVNGNVQLDWTTSLEFNNKGFEVQRRNVSDNEEWHKVIFVDGMGNAVGEHEYTYTDQNLANGNYEYRLKQIDFDGSFEYSETVEVEVVTPIEYSLSQNYPNPFNPTTTIKYSIPDAGNVSLNVYNILGQQVKTLVDGFKEAGSYSIKFDAVNLNSGMYFYKLEAGNFTKVMKMTLVK